MSATFDLQSASARLSLNQAIWMIKAFGRTSYRGMYVRDEIQGKVLYVSDNCSFFYGGGREEIMTRDVSFFEHSHTSKDRQYYDEVQHSYNELIRDWPVEEIEKTTLSMHLHIVSQRGMESLIHYQSTPLLVRSDGKILLTLCVLSLPNYKGQAHAMCYDSSHGRLYEYSLSQHHWVVVHQPILTENEKDIYQPQRRI